MKKALLLFTIVIAVTFACKTKKSTTETISDPNAYTNQPPPQQEIAKTYTYDSVPGDPLKARIYTLENGLKVYLSVYKNAPRIQTYIAVRAGSKNDPADATGLAHYLEHMLFKGTDKYGSKDYAKEAPLLDEIEKMFERYRLTTDETARKNIYHQIDSLSGVAAQFAIANEYDKITAALGAKGTNAHTWVEETVYENDVPSNQLEKWLILEAERFRHPVMRIFHTELEAVYEEKNISLDNDGNKSFEALMAGLFQKHQYGTQTTIGTIEHLKNPSLTEIKKYYDKYYVPNNMALCLSGDFDPDQTIRLIDKHFGNYKRKEVPQFQVQQEAPILSPIVKNVYGPEAASMGMGFRLPKAGSREADLMLITDKLLYNSRAGLFDLNLNQAQKVLSAYTFTMEMADYSVHFMGADVKEGQKLDQAKDLLLAEIEKLKNGNFPDWLMNAVITDMKYQNTKSYENNSSRANSFVNAFILDVPWKDYTLRMERLSQYTKADVMQFVRQYYNNNYVIVYKNTGEDKNVQKVVKPAITPVAVNREERSPFLMELANLPAAEIQPVFVDYSKDIKSQTLPNTLPLLYTENKENATFDLYYVFEMGTLSNRKLGLAIDYLPYLGTSKYTPKQMQEEFYKLGCSYNVFSSEEQVWVSLSGLSENFIAAVDLFDQLLQDPKADKTALKNLIDDELKSRKDAKLNKNTILFGLRQYGTYGLQNPFNYQLTEKELRAVKPEELTGLIKGLNGYQHRILLYGSVASKVAFMSLNSYHKVTAPLKPVPENKLFTRQETGNQVFVVDYDMKQAEIMMISKSVNYNPALAPKIQLFNEYFGGNMSSVVFQELRESKALAYSTNASFRAPGKKEDPYYINSYIGTQADKMPEAMKGMRDLLNKMPETDVLFDAAKASILQSLRSERVTQAGILFNYERARKMGLSYDIRQDIFKQVPNLTLTDLRSFQTEYLANRTYTVMVLGKKSDLDLKTLEQYGTVKFLSLKDLFGY